MRLKLLMFCRGRVFSKIYNIMKSCKIQENIMLCCRNGFILYLRSSSAFVVLPTGQWHQKYPQSLSLHLSEQNHMTFDKADALG